MWVELLVRVIFANPMDEMFGVFEEHEKSVALGCLNSSRSFLLFLWNIRKLTFTNQLSTFLSWISWQTRNMTRLKCIFISIVKYILNLTLIIILIVVVKILHFWLNITFSAFSYSRIKSRVYITSLCHSTWTVRRCCNQRPSIFSMLCTHSHRSTKCFTKLILKHSFIISY